MKVYSVIIFITFVISLIFAEEEQTFQGACPEVVTQRDLQKAEYEGEWYEIKRFVNTLIPDECGIATYVQREHGYNISYLSKNLEKKEPIETEMFIEKEIVKSPFAKYDVYYDCEKNKISHYILETDYTTYSVVWGCTQTGEENNIVNTQRLFIYSRQKTLDEANNNKVIEVLKKFNIDHTQLKDVEQSDEKCGGTENQI